MKCIVCAEAAVIDVRRHNANFCAEHFLRHCRQQVERTCKEFSMVSPGDQLLLAVSGGKDSLALWDILSELGYQCDGLYVGLGIENYSELSLRHARAFAQTRNLKLIEADLEQHYGYTVPLAASSTGRVPCSACGLSKRHIFDSFSLEGGYDALVTGHNLDDEAAVLYGNVMRWQTSYLGRQRPVLKATGNFPRKIKPLVRLGERETAAYCVLRQIDYLIEECPMAKGNKHLRYKEALNQMELESPGSKSAFYFGFIDRAVDNFDTTDSTGPSSICRLCSAPTDAEVCAFCRMRQRCNPDSVAVHLKATRRQD